MIARIGTIEVCLSGDVPIFDMFRCELRGLLIERERTVMRVMPLKFTREPYRDHSNSAEVSFDGRMYAMSVDGYVGIQFSTKPDGLRRSHFRAAIGAAKFEELARLMVEADPQAVGAAMKDVEIQKRETDASEVVAA